MKNLNYKLIHPFLFSIFPIIALYSNNISESSSKDALICGFISLIITIILFVILAIVNKNKDKVGLLISLSLLFFFYGGLIYSTIINYSGLELSRYIYLVLYTIVYGTIVFFISKMPKDIKFLTPILNVIAVTLILLNFGKIFIHSFQVDNKKLTSQETEIDTKELNQNYAKTSELPDIYYIILDGYARADILKDIFKFDNSEFINYLEKKGFYVPKNSIANYPQTQLSLGSSLNMEYLNYLSNLTKTEAMEKKINLVKNNKLIKFLKQKGYHIISINSDFYVFSDMKNIDKQINCIKSSEFINVLLSNSIIFPFLPLYYDNLKRTGMLCEFDTIGNSYKFKSPRFIFTHICSPHPPFLFKADGSKATKDVIWFKGNTWSQKNNYIQQLEFTNNKVKEFVNMLITNNKRPLIIILQADHGSAATFSDALLTKNPNNTNINERMKIFLAIYQSGAKQQLFYDNISAVNIFRIILNNYFGCDLPLLKDESYYASYTTDNYQFINVTNRIKSAPK